MPGWMKSLWQSIRQLSGDDAYERYLAHYATHQADAKSTGEGQDLAPPLSREAFFKQWQDSKWKGVKRCC